MFLDISKGFLFAEQDLPFQTEVILEPQIVFGEELRFSPVHLEGTYQVTAEDTVVVKGNLETAVYAHCSLCSAEVVLPLAIDFDEVFTKTADEIEEEEFLYEGKKLPLDHMTLTLCMLQIPMRFVCPEGCKEDVEVFLGHEEYRPHPEEETATYYPFADLAEKLNRS